MDISEIQTIVTTADVFGVGFRLFPERLIIDTRQDAKEIPLVAIVDPVASLQERYFWLGQHRPSLGVPQSFMFFAWQHSIGYLEESGVWEQICDRVIGSGVSGAAQTCAEALGELLRRERRAHVDAIVGAKYETLWSVRE